jgi:acyl transferase domain-containing protein
MDAAETYSSRLHVAGENASVLTATCTLADADRVAEAGQVEVVGVIGNSMGWYTALTVAGALPLAEGLRLIETMGQYQANNVVGGQIVYPLCDPDWTPETAEPVTSALRDIPGLYVSIRLGRQIVLGGTDEAIRSALRTLPERKAGERSAPFQLPLHSAFHTPLLTETAQRAQSDLADLDFRSPKIPLIDGRGQVFFPRHADPVALRDYTLGAQVTAPYDFTVSVRTALREFAPDAFVLLGPGANLGGATAQAVLEEGWAGMQTKADFMERQSRAPLLLSLLRPEQRALVLG